MKLNLRSINAHAAELFDEIGNPIVRLESIVDGDGSLRVVAGFDIDLAEEIVTALKLLNTMRAALVVAA